MFKFFVVVCLLAIVANTFAQTTCFIVTTPNLPAVGLTGKSHIAILRGNDITQISLPFAVSVNYITKVW